MISVSCIIFKSDDNKILLQHRAIDAKNNPNLWGFFGGHLEKGETPAQALEREIEEELSIFIKNYKFYKTFKYKNKKGHEVIKHIFVAPLEFNVEGLRAKQNEGQNLGLFSFDEIEKLKTIPHDFEVIQDVFNI